MLDIVGNPYEKSKISYALARNPFEKRENSHVKLRGELPLGLSENGQER